MGAAQSGTSKVETIPTKEPNSELPAGHFGVSVSGGLVEKGLLLDSNVEEQISAAYRKGKEEGMASLESSLAVVAAQVYDNVQDQISSFQDKHLEQSEKLVSIEIENISNFLEYLS